MMMPSSVGQAAVLGVVTPALGRTAETFVARHIRELAPGRTVVVCFKAPSDCTPDFPFLCVSRPDRSGMPWLIRSPIMLYSLLRHGYSGALDSDESKKLTRFLKERKVASVLVEYGTSACVVREACVRAGAALFVHFHGYDASANLGRWRHAYLRLANDVAGIVCPSDFLANKLEAIGMPPCKMHIIPCGVDEDEFAPSGDKDENLALAVGRFTEKKAPNLTIEAFARIADCCPQLRLEMIGTGPLMEECKRLADNLSLADRIAFHGAREHAFVRERMRRAVIFLQHSVTARNGDSEGLGLSVLEAMACEVPVIATRHNGFVETVVEGETGFLVDEHDVEGMGAAIENLVQRPDLRARLGKAGRRRVIEHFSAKRQIGRLRALLGIRVQEEASGPR